MIGIIICAIFGIYVGIKFHQHNETLRLEAERKQRAMLARLEINELSGFEK